MKIGQRCTCLFCLSEGGLELRLDKKSRPFFICSGCGVRCFLRGEASLRGPSVLWGPLTIAIQNGEAEVARTLVARAVQRVSDEQANADGA